MSPTSGPSSRLTVIVISGTGFSSPGTKFTLAGRVLLKLGGTDDQLSTGIPSGLVGSYDLIVENSAGDRFVLENAYTYFAAPVINGVSPNTGPATGGTSIILSGEHLSTATQVTFGNITASDLDVIDGNRIAVTSPAHVAGQVPVKVKTAGGEVEINPGFTFIPSPTITDISPVFGGGDGGTFVTLTGTNFTGATKVSVGGRELSQLVVLNATTITGRTGPGVITGEYVAVEVWAPGGVGKLNSAYIYADPPTIVSVSPSSGTTEGGTQITLEGTNLFAGSTVRFGSVSATAVTAVPGSGNTQLLVTTPAAAPQVVDVSVTQIAGTASAPSAYTYNALPRITAISPARGSISGGHTVSIDGVNLDAVSDVLFGGTSATDISQISNSRIEVTTPPSTLGVVDIDVITSQGEATVAAAYTYVANAPVVHAVTPDEGPITGSTPVTVTGVGFLHVTDLTVGGVAASFDVIDDNSITLVAPAHAAGAVQIRVANSEGNSSKNFVYRALPTISSISPSFGSVAGGESVVMTGANLQAATVTIGGFIVAPTTNTATRIEFVTPASGTVGSVDISVTTAGGMSTVDDGYTFVAAPSISDHPSNVSISRGESATFTVTASDTTSYQWQVNTGSGFENISNGGVYSGANSPTLTIAGAPMGMAGHEYRVIASGAVCSASAPVSQKWVCDLRRVLVSSE